MAHTHWIDRVTAPIAPAWTLRRQRARVALDLIARHYEGATVGRRATGWSRTAGDANAMIAPAAASLRAVARDLVRNNPYAESAVSTIADHTVGYGIVATPAPGWWDAWAGTTACDADGLHDFVGLQKLIMTTVAESGEVLVRKRMRRAEDGLPIPMQLQVLEPDYLDAMQDRALPGGGQIIHGVEYDALGKRVAYWLYPSHPGSARGTAGSSTTMSGSRRIQATEILHIFKAKRPGQTRGVTWFAPVVLRFKNVDKYEDATLEKALVAACLAVITSDVDGTGSALGTAATGTAADGSSQAQDLLSPGAIINAAPGRSVDVVQPPSTADYPAFMQVNLRAIATGLGVGYEDLTGDYTTMSFSAARMSRLRHFARVDDWRWRLLIPQFCDPVYRWATEAAAIAGLPAQTERAQWTPPPLPMIEPDKEGLAIMRNIRVGITSLSEAQRERGFVPSKLLKEIADDYAALDKLGIVLDCDPRQMTQAGQRQADPAAKAAAPEKEPEEDDDTKAETDDEPEAKEADQ